MGKKKPTAPYENLIRMNWVLVQKWRLGSGYSQRQAAAACGLDPRTWRRCEHGQDVEILTAARVAKKTKIPFDDLLKAI